MAPNLKYICDFDMVMDTLCIYSNIKIFTLFYLWCGVPADTVVIRNELEICVKKAASAIEKLLENEGERHNKIQSCGD